MTFSRGLSVDLPYQYLVSIYSTVNNKGYSTDQFINKIPLPSPQGIISKC
jgi:hypothetical protein